MLDDRYAGSREAVPDAFSVITRVGLDEIVLVLEGQADAAAGPLLAHALTQAASQRHLRISVDLADVEFIDTHCLELIFSARDKLRTQGADLVLHAPRPSVRRLLEILERQDLIENA